MSALRAFLSELIDDAGLFPPARLSMADALAAHERAEASGTCWMLGRFVVPASRLEEMLAHLDAASDPLSTSVVLDGNDPKADLARIANLARSTERIAVESLEWPIARVAGANDDECLVAFFEAFERAEFPIATDLYAEVAIDGSGLAERALSALRRARDVGRSLAAKVRCGGLVAEAVPGVARLAEFVWRAQDVGVPFKATAGLHHPVRAHDKAAGFVMHGFLNLIGAAVLAYARALDRATLERVIADEDASHFRLDEEAFAWDGIAVDAGSVGAARRTFVLSYGSCSFDEPCDDLRVLGILEGRAK